ncbi:hypothetical protein DEAC_c37350 [Desulfosporosinus acididurans]|uniref:DUF5104 domain-containing protein n=1 Tax=Desulfosporosinus acididurans TaxID=476652 RepID=A0A0J1FLF2_9FIRM|nr:DUF5104 domain-containing protein [Desulfosporosinus acididurans]KLU64305.1 hypothetical protein DEAC_c37350 [Desulfosporosinus acididurans]
MRKITYAILLIIIACLLSSCSLGGSRAGILNKESDDKKADAQLEQVIVAIQNQDKNALRAMFSKQALAEAKDFDGSMNYLFKLFQGKVQSKKNDGLIVDESDNYGHSTNEVKSFYIVETDKQKYLFFLLEYTTNTDQSNVGLYSLRVIKAEDENTQFSSWQKMKIAGIYKP